MHHSASIELNENLSDIDFACPDENTVVSWDLLGNVLSRYGDSVWKFQKKNKRLYRVEWSEANYPISDPTTNELTKKTKQLALLKISLGTSITTSTLSSYLATLKKLKKCCLHANCDLLDVVNRPGFFDSFNFTEKQRLAAIARLSIGAESKIGWIWLKKESISDFLEKEAPESNQTPVIPFMLWEHSVDKAIDAANIFLRYLPELTSICAEYAHSRKSRRTRGKTWIGIASGYPSFYTDLSRIGCLVENFVSHYITYVTNAAFWLIASGSGARRSEIDELESGCYSESDVNGLTVGVITGATTKTQNLPNTVWIVSPRAKLGVEVLEQRLKWYQQINPSADSDANKLFQNIDFTLGRSLPPSQKRTGKVQIGLVGRAHKETFLDSLNTFTITPKLHDEAVALTPSLDRKKFFVGGSWKFASHQARRTVFMLAAATGLVSRDSIALQAKHKTLAMTDYYTNFFWRIRIEYPDDPLASKVDLNLAREILEQYVENYNRDLTHIASQERFFSPYGDAHKKKTIESVPMLNAKEIQQGIKADVLRKSTLGLCSEMDFCPHHSAISVRGCMVKANGSPCGKAIVDAERIGLITAVQNDQRTRLSSLGHSDIFEREQIAADIEAAQNAIDLILSHRDNHNE